jgi:aryl-alcohol dehydrogenase-like predicted oxidoreductase
VSNFSRAQLTAFRSASPLHVVQSPYNLFERQIEADILPYAKGHRLTVLAYGALCRGLLTGRMRHDTRFTGDDLRGSDPKFLPPCYAQYLKAVEVLDDLARRRYGKASSPWRSAACWTRAPPSPSGAARRQATALAAKTPRPRRVPAAPSR